MNDGIWLVLRVARLAGYITKPAHPWFGAWAKIGKTGCQKTSLLQFILFHKTTSSYHYFLRLF